jgi:hypothetical protein
MEEQKMKKGILVVMMLVMASMLVSAAKPTKCTTIQDGTLLASDGTTIMTGYDQWGYNYQAHMFNGGYCDAYRDAAWCQPWAEDYVIMKWNDAWLSNNDCDNDNLLDRHYGFPTYIGSGAWLTNHISGTYEGVGTDYWDVTGTYVINVEWLGNDYPETLVLTQVGEDITGVSLDTIPPGSFFTVYDGSVIGNVINIYANRGSLIVHMEGTIALDGTMSGTWHDDTGQLGFRTGTWETTTGGASGYQVCYWSDFYKIVAAPADATKLDGVWYTADGVEIGTVIWGEFAIIQEVYNDPCSGFNGIAYNGEAPTGFGFYNPA